MQRFLLTSCVSLLFFFSATTHAQIGVMIRDHVFFSFTNEGCSAGVTDFGAQDILMILAGHCVTNPDPNHEFDILMGARSRRRLIDFYSYEKKLTAKVGSTVRIPADDIAYLRIPRSTVGGGEIPKLAEKPPIPGEPLTLLGYPGGNGPVKIRCWYRAANFVFNKSLGHFTLTHRAACAPIESVGGASGSAVLNERGEYIGVLTAQDFRSKKELTVFFVMILRRNITQEKTRTILLERQGEVELDAMHPLLEIPIKLKLTYDNEGFVKFARMLFEGGLTETAEFLRSVPHGEQLIYNPDGSLYSRRIYKQGVEIR